MPPEQVRLILLSTDSDNDLARRFKRSHTAIANLRTGRTYADLWPELPSRSPTRSCHDCQQWLHGRCSLGFPDSELEGLGSPPTASASLPPHYPELKPGRLHP